MLTSWKWARWLLCLAVVLLAFAMVGCDDDDDDEITLRALLSGGQEVPPVVTDATGIATVRINDAQTAIDVTLDTANLTNVTAAHIHVGAVGENGPVIFDLFTGPVGTFPDPLTIRLTAADLQARPDEGITTFQDAIDAMLNGETYVNVHTTQNPEGEIRGQLGRVQMRATLTGGDVVPPVVTTASAVADVIINRTQREISIEMTSTNVIGVTSITLRLGDPGEEGPALFSVFANGGGVLQSPLRRTLDAGDLIITPGSGISNFSDAVREILAGNTYLEVRTLANPEGEIRGQIDEVVVF